MKDLLTIGLLIFAWIALNRWVLPAMGIQTCMSGACCGSSCEMPAERSVVPATDKAIEQEQKVDSTGNVPQEDVVHNQ